MLMEILLPQTQVPETLQAVSQAIPQRLPQNLTRWTGSKATASTQVAQETAAGTPSVLSTSPSPSRNHLSTSPMSKILSPPKPTTQLTGAPQDDDDKSKTSDGEGAGPTENGTSRKSIANGGNTTGKDIDSSNDGLATDLLDPKAATSGWLSSWWGTAQANPSSTDPQSIETPKPEPIPLSTEPTASKVPPTLPSIENLKADSKVVHKVKSAEVLGLKRNKNLSTASIRTAPPTFVDSTKPTITVEGPPISNDPPAIVPTTAPPTEAQSSSWFGYWYGASGPATAINDKVDGNEMAMDTADIQNQTENSNTQPLQENDSNTPAASTEALTEAPPQPTSNDGILARGAAWVFWSKPQPPADEPGKPSETGEIAIAGSSTETEPQKAKLTTPSPQPTSTAQKRSASPSWADNRPGSASAAQPPSIAVAPKEVSPAAKNLQKILPPNLLVPSFDSCFNPQQSRSWFQLPSAVNRLWSTPKTVSRTQLSIVPILPRIRKTVAIGVHGFFPMKLVQRVLGEPTGTSVRFATEGAAAIQRWADSHNVSVDIEKIALEGEGRVSDRVEVLWKLLENKLDVIENADFILVCCHSQGTPVGVHLVARMIEYGLVEKTKIGIIGMAGINLGPFGELNSRILSGSAKELFEFSSPTSLVSQQYIESLTAVLAHGVKLVFVGSIDDQLVSLYSSTFSNISHPFIYRAVFVDGRVHAPDFISHVVGLALKLRNIGVRDHGIIRELSSPLAGSLYSGEGHSRIYDDAAIYDLGVRHTLETNTKEFLRVPLKVEDFQLPSTSNPYILPWAMRGMLEEKKVLEELQDESRTLLEEFAKWQPVSKVLKDVKFRLEAIRSKL
ncbi:hypothetical protein ABW20_dc0106583 [Dactylellina cionopaga]|nr:hypothetical protein ABW20_dc0106583 [Dactylellina cionopaga]